MSKLPEGNRFWDFSDYGRPFAVAIANALKATSISPVQVTWSFVMVGLAAIWAIWFEYYTVALLLLIIKSILDAADGELARVKSTPSYTGRYFDSIADWILNLGIIICIGIKLGYPLPIILFAFASMELQGTLYNYYYVILRYKHAGDTTSRIIETNSPKAFEGESQKMVDFLFNMYRILYGPFDRLIYELDPSASVDRRLSKSFMTMVSTCGLGFQLLLIGILLIVNCIQWILPFFICYNVMIALFILTRK